MHHALLFLAPLLAPQNQWLPQGTTKQPLPVFQQEFGESVALDGTTLVVGIEGDDVGAEDAGAVEVYELVGWAPELRATLRASDPEKDAAFGFEVDCDGDTILVGAPHWGKASGAAYVFERSGGVWTEKAALETSSIEGDNVALRGDLIALPGYSTVDLYRRAAGNWTLEQVLDPPIIGNGATCQDIAIDGDRVLVGATNATGSTGIQHGLAFVYEWNGASFDLVATLEPDDGVPYDYFGLTVAAEDGTILVGAPFKHSATANFVGAVYCFELQGSTWSQLQKLTPNLSPSVYSGSAIALEGDLALVSSSGYLHAYDRTGGVWAKGPRLSPGTAGSTGPNFGNSIALQGSQVVLGNPGQPTTYGQVESLAVDPQDGTFYAVDRATGLLLHWPTVGPGYNPPDTIQWSGFTGLADVRGLALDPTSGTLFAIDTASGVLYTLDRLTAIPTAIGATGFGAIEGLAFDSLAGRLYGSDIDQDVLVAIDPGDASTTVIGPLGLNNVRGLGFDAATSTLYGVNVPNQKLVTIDTATGKGTKIALVGQTDLAGLAFHDSAGALYASSPQRPYEVDTGSGYCTSSSVQYVFYSAGAIHLLDYWFGPPCLVCTGYCTAGTSAAGCTTTLIATGTPQLSQPYGFLLTGKGGEGAVNARFFYGVSGRQAAPWGTTTSFQCVVPPVTRGPMIHSVGQTALCDGLFQQDLDTLWSAEPQKAPLTGVPVQAQLWYRDAQSTANPKTGLSDAVEFTVVP